MDEEFEDRAVDQEARQPTAKEAERENNVMKPLSPEDFGWATYTNGSRLEYLVGIGEDQEVLHYSTGDELERRERLKELQRKKESEGIIVYHMAETIRSQFARAKNRATNASGRVSSSLHTDEEHDPLSWIMNRPRINDAAVAVAVSMPAVVDSVLRLDGDGDDVLDRDGDDVLDGDGDDVPLDVKNHVEGLGGNEICLVCEKYLTTSDVNEKEHRLLMPMQSIKWPSFLREDERKLLETRTDSKKVSEIPIPLLEPTARPGMSICETIIKLRRWEMRKKGGKSATAAYVLVGGWSGVVARNSLKKGNLVKVWSFRVGSELRLAVTVARA